MLKIFFKTNEDCIHCIDVSNKISFFDFRKVLLNCASRIDAIVNSDYQLYLRDDSFGELGFMKVMDISETGSPTHKKVQVLYLGQIADLAKLDDRYGTESMPFLIARRIYRIED